jgi:hypothetical protein
MKNKNLWLLPTKHPSRLQLQMNGNLHIENGKTITLKSFQNIHITSDKEIRKNDWVLFKCNGATEIVRVTAINNNAFESKQGFGYGLEYCKKIILTTDQELIKDGVQAIDDDFLEWFVKNPSCEKVFITNDFEQVNQDNPILRGSTNSVHKYKISIPKEEPGQETLEEATVRIVGSGLYNSTTLFKLGAKWQQEQAKNKYSEEDLRQAFLDGEENMDYSDIHGWSSKLTQQQWFERFKTNNMETAGQILKKCPDYWQGGKAQYCEDDAKKAMIEFATLHVNEALRQASEKARIKIDVESTSLIVDKDSILNSYSFE